jgi:hypothetical protein
MVSVPRHPKCWPVVASQLVVAFALAVLAFACATGVDDFAFPGDAGDAGDAADPSANDAAGEVAADAQAEAQMDSSRGADAASSADSIAAPESGDGAPGSADSSLGSADAAAESGDAAAESGDAAGESAADAPPEASADASVDATEGSAADAVATGRVVFVSSALYDGNLGGLSGADSKCQGLASAAGLAGTYKAWLSDSTTAAASRLTHATTPYVLADGTVVAQGWSQLVGGGDLLHAVTETESGGPAPVGSFQCSPGEPTVWTNTDPYGKRLTANCSDWTSNTVAPGFVGVANTALSPWWTEDCESGPGLAQVTCADTAAIYCIQQ